METYPQMVDSAGLGPTSLISDGGGVNKITLRFLSWNIRGLNDHRKICKMAAYFHIR